MVAALSICKALIGLFLALVGLSGTDTVFGLPVGAEPDACAITGALQILGGAIWYATRRVF